MITDGTATTAAADIPPELLAAFRLFLGRKPNKDRLPEYQTHFDLNRMLAKSAEFQASHQAVKAPLGWPLSQVFVSKPARILYCPIGKNACTFMKSTVACTAQLPFTSYMLRDIHFLTDHIRTGLQLSDYTLDQVERLKTTNHYFKFAVLRDPMDRLLSAYIEKFVMGRLSPANIHHTKTVIIPVQKALGMAPVDYDRGISFRDFVTYVAQADPTKLDPHWRPQTLYLAGIDYDRLFRTDQIEELMQILEERSGMALDRQARNVTGSGKGTPLTGAADLLPAQIVAAPRIARDSFFDADTQAIIRRVFADDFALLQQT